MENLRKTMTKRIMEAGSVFQQERTGHTPQSVSTVLGEDTLVITLHGALSPAEIILARSAAGAAQIREFHRQLFAHSSDALRQEIKRITGVEVHAAVAEIEPSTGTMVQVFHLTQRLPEELLGGVLSTPRLPRAVASTAVSTSR
ncbi:MAG: Na-translocating system protein MpsC family protein [Phycisphaerae bacterium]